MKEYKVNLTTQFKEELKKTLYFFQYSYKTRRKMHYEIRNTVLSLSILLERYSRLKLNSRNKNIRKLLVNKFVITYEVDNEKKKSIFYIYFHKNKII